MSVYVPLPLGHVGRETKSKNGETEALEGQGKEAGQAALGGQVQQVKQNTGKPFTGGPRFRQKREQSQGSEEPLNI